MNEDAAFVATVVIPALNEEADIGDCIDCIAAQTVGASRLQVVLVDAGSDDETCARARSVASRARFGAFEVVSSRRPRTSAVLNAGLEAARGPILVRVDARSRIPSDYVARCVELLEARPRAGVVGGRQVARPRSDRVVPRSIARALRNRITTGFAAYRRRRVDGPADTVWMGVFRSEELRALGGWDEATALNEDFELCERYRRAGFDVWLLADVSSGYLPRRSLWSLAVQHFYFGRVKGTWWARGRRPSARQWMLVGLPPLGVAAWVAVARRWGVVRALAAVPVAGLVVDHLGSDEPAPGSVRVTAAAVSALASASWWAGVVVGVAGERLGVQHRHG